MNSSSAAVTRAQPQVTMTSNRLHPAQHRSIQERVFADAFFDVICYHLSSNVPAAQQQHLFFDTAANYMQAW
jgi:hypothetical protein